MMHHMMMVGAVMNNMMVGHMMAYASAPGRPHPAARRCAHRAGGGSHAAVRARRAAGRIDGRRCRGIRIHLRVAGSGAAAGLHRLILVVVGLGERNAAREGKCRSAKR